jgi:hypothetical protein
MVSMFSPDSPRMLALVGALRRAIRAGDERAVSLTSRELRQRSGRRKAGAMVLRLGEPAEPAPHVPAPPVVVCAANVGARAARWRASSSCSACWRCRRA